MDKSFSLTNRLRRPAKPAARRDGKIVKAFAFFDSVAFNESWEWVKSN